MKDTGLSHLKLESVIEHLFKRLVEKGYIDFDPYSEHAVEQRAAVVSAITHTLESKYNEGYVPEDLFKDRDFLQTFAETMLCLTAIVQDPKLSAENPELVPNINKALLEQSNEVDKKLDEHALVPSNEQIDELANDNAKIFDDMLIVVTKNRKDNKEPDAIEALEERSAAAEANDDRDFEMDFGITRQGVAVVLQSGQQNVKGRIDMGPAFSSRGGHLGRGLGDSGSAENAEYEHMAEERELDLGDFAEATIQEMMDRGVLSKSPAPKH